MSYIEVGFRRQSKKLHPSYKIGEARKSSAMRSAAGGLKRLRMKRNKEFGLFIKLSIRLWRADYGGNSIAPMVRGKRSA